MRKIVFIFLLPVIMQKLSAQELFVFSEPASNMPAKSMSAKVTARFPDSKYNNFFKQRYTPEIMFGISPQVMVHLSSTFSDFYTPEVNWESAKLYAKWRFYAKDGIHSHFRLAAFAEGSYSKSPFLYSDINLEGDNSGIQGGLIATGLLNRLAVSGSASLIRVFGETAPYSAHEDYATKALAYSISSGYLLFPREYTSFQQPNVNLYMEMIGMRGLNEKHYMVDLAPSIQLILNSNFKINAGYRFQIAGNMLRVGERSWQFGLERTFLSAFGQKKKSRS